MFQHPKNVPGSSKSRPRVLLMDYDPQSIEQTRNALHAAGLVVEVVTDGLSGLTVFNEMKPDLVLIEAMLPKKHGFEVCQELKKTPEGKRTPVLITTAVYKGRKYRNQAMHMHGCDEFIEKPIDDAQLVALCRRFLGRAAEHTEDGRPVTFEARESEPAAEPTHPHDSPAAIVGDLTEEEILARLDEVLPSERPAEAGLSQRSDQVHAAVYEELDPDLAPQLPELAQAGDATFDGFARVTMPEPATAEESGIPDWAVIVDQALGPSPAPAQPAEVLSGHESPREASEPPSVQVPAVPTVLPVEPALPVASEAPAKLTRPPHRLTGTEHVARSQTLPLSERKGTPGWLWFAAAMVVAAAIGGYFLLGGPSKRTTDRPEVPFVNSDIAASKPPAHTAPAETSPTPDGAAPLRVLPTPEAPSRTADLPPPASRSEASQPAARKTSATVPAVPVSQEPSAQDQRAEVIPRPSEAAPPSPTPSVSDPPSDATPLPAVALAQPLADQAAERADEPSQAVTVPEEGPAQPNGTAKTLAGTLVPIGEVDSEPVLELWTQPEYTRQARFLRQKGIVVLSLLVDENGQVAEVKVLKGIPGSDLNDSAVRAANRWVYRPATKDGVNVKVWTTKTVNFGQ